MRIEQLSRAVAVARTGSMRLAAEQLYISQPNLSIAIKNLEEELGYKVFIRTNRGVQLTSLGRIFIRSAENIMEQFDQLAATSLMQNTQAMRVFSLAAMPYRYLTLASMQLYEAHKEVPIHLTLQSGDRDEIINFVSKDTCELGVLSIYRHYYERTLHKMACEGLQFTKLSEHAICVLVGKHSPLYHHTGDTISRQMLEGRCFVGFSELEYGAYSSLPDLLGLGHSHCPQRIYASTWSLILDIIGTTDSFTIVATNRKAYSKTPYYDGVKSFTLAECDETCVIGWISKEGRALSPLATEYLEILSDYF